VLLIGFGHKARQGKNTAAFATLKEMPIDANAKIYAFGDALRAEIRTAARQLGGGESRLIQAFKEAGIMPDWVETETGKSRLLLQWWGTDYRRAQDQRYWLKKLFAQIDRDRVDVALIADIRFLNEAEEVKKRGGLLVKCTRTGAPDIVVHEHPSEKELISYAGWNFEIKAATIADAQKQAADIYAEITRRAGQ
jgi:hypothetical protein